MAGFESKQEAQHSHPFAPGALGARQAGSGVARPEQRSLYPLLQTSTSVTRPRRPPRSVSTHAASTPMAPSAVSAAQDLHPRTSRTTARPPGRGPEPRRPQALCSAPAHSGPCRAPSRPLVRMRCLPGGGQRGGTGGRTKHEPTEGGMSFTAPATLCPSYRRCGTPGLAHGPLHIPFPFYKNFRLKNTYFVPSASVCLCISKSGSRVYSLSH